MGRSINHNREISRDNPFYVNNTYLQNKFEREKVEGWPAEEKRKTGKFQN